MKQGLADFCNGMSRICVTYMQSVSSKGAERIINELELFVMKKKGRVIFLFALFTALTISCSDKDEAEKDTSGHAVSRKEITEKKK